MKIFICLFCLKLALLNCNIYAQTLAPLWNDYVAAKAKGETPFLPDFSFAGYHFSEKPLPDVSEIRYFNVLDYGALPDDGKYDDLAIQKAIDAAQMAGGGVIFFPKGRYNISPDSDNSKSIEISSSNIILKGSGAGKGGTEILMDSMRIGKRQFHFSPISPGQKKIATIKADALRESFWVEVDDLSRLEIGKQVVLSHQSETYTRHYFGDLPLADEWTRLFGEKGGMRIAEIHTIEKIEGKRVKFKNPIHLDIIRIKDADFELHSFTAISECGIEDIMFSGNWNQYPEQFEHHKNAIHDSGWCGVSMEYVTDSWIKNCVFNNMNEGIFIRAGYKVSVDNVVFTGKKGHSSVHARGGYGVLINNCRFEAGNHHGPGTGYGGVGTVITNCIMQPDQNIDSHSGQPYATLFDNTTGGIFKNIGGPLPGLPHHGKYLVFWNFKHQSTFDFHYKFWDVNRRRNHTFAKPVFVGFKADRQITFEDEGINQLQGIQASPQSLFEAQLKLRLNQADKLN
ncbi:DUF4955 domain-containing protein [Olivibacter domesticus]|uniref:Right handed beta helix region n=1 Tax=Olivibacter domesticus TaxID=407022 RepID=A0A1H7QEG3_OLID1|nr:DUF4955 domain-containing protein [Olivibacter domesticus]SEL46480.1 Right handed beta helix region [Olivibacter domesticus]